MIVITGAAGFIGSCLVSTLNQKGIFDLLLVDDFTKTNKQSNLSNKKYKEKIDRLYFIQNLSKYQNNISYIIHIGARTDTTEFNFDIFEELNISYTQKLWSFATSNNIPFIYASSAATYGMGELGYSDDHQTIPQLQPLNPYGISKNEVDKWILLQESSPSNWYGLKFFNVYGPNEYHKGRMASVIFHAFHQIINTGEMKLFRSHNIHFKDGEQLRDFIYVFDLIEIILFLMNKKPLSGIYNVGTGKAESFNELANCVFEALQIKPNIHYIDTPIDIRDKYQYFTEAKMDKLISAGYNNSFKPLKEGVFDYVKNYLLKNEKCF
jgi:ADP-L-glycero-D-manno-heptose 6-epimerase